MLSLVDAMIDNYTQTYSARNTHTNYLFLNNQNMGLKDNLKRLMDERGENPHSLSLRSRVPQPTIFRILKGTSADPRRDNVVKLARALGVDVDVLYGKFLPVALVATEPRETEYQAPKTNEEEKMLRALRLASPDQHRMLMQLAEHILEDVASFDERAGTH
jgi:transcriptional regulator with XRE-family HTH domain